MNKWKEIGIEYFKNSFKSEANMKIGMECEFFVVDDNYKNIPYEKMSSILETQLNNDNKGIFKDDHLLGIENKKYLISLEPGSQFEISINASKNIKTIDDIYMEFYNHYEKIFENHGYKMLSVGVCPVSHIDEITMIPKKRYEYMADYLINQGELAHHMMKGTAATHYTIDYIDEEDYIVKTRVLNVLGVILARFLDNSPYINNIESKFNLARVHIWEKTDKFRSGMNYGCFDKDFSFDKYIDYALSVPPIFIKQNNKEIYTESKLLTELDIDENIENFTHLVSMIFPYVRAKGYLELRTIDAIPYPYNVSVIAVLKGLLYNPKHLFFLEQTFYSFKEEDYHKLVEELKEGNTISYLNDKSVDQYMTELIGMAFDGLDEKELKFLDPLYDLLDGESLSESTVYNIKKMNN